MTALSSPQHRHDEPDWAQRTAVHTQLSHLEALEAESIHIFREVAAEFERPVLLFTGGKDSVVMLHLAAKAFWPAPIPFPVMHVDTGHNFPEVLEFPRRSVERLGAASGRRERRGLDRQGPGGRGERPDGQSATRCRP